VGKRYLKIKIPVPPSREKADEVSSAFRTYYTALAEAREGLNAYLACNSDHHFFFSGADAPDLADEPDFPLDHEISAEAEN
jgi:hypothetical protein